MRIRRTVPNDRSSAATHTVPSRVTRTLEQQIEEIMTKVAPRRQADAEARGVVSALFVTISDFVALCEEIEPPEIGSIFEVYLDTVADSVGKFLGTLQNTMGDTVMATWNAVSPQPDHAVLAVYSAIDMVERIEDVNLRLRVRLLPEIAYAVGVNTGDALVQRTGLPRRENETVGDAVNVAYLLSRLAPKCGILIGEGTRVSVGDQVLVEDSGIVQLPGKSKPVHAFRVIGRPERHDDE